MTAVVDNTGRLCGIFTDGDLRRTLDGELDIHRCRVSQVITRDCKTVKPHILAAEGLRIMQESKINALLVVDDHDRLVGAINMHDLLRAGVV